MLIFIAYALFVDGGEDLLLIHVHVCMYSVCMCTLCVISFVLLSKWCNCILVWCIFIIVQLAIILIINVDGIGQI